MGSARSWTGSEVARLSDNARGYGGMVALELDTPAWERMGSPRPQCVPVARAASSAATLRMFGKPSQSDLQTLVLDVRHGPHEASIRVTSVVGIPLGIALVIPSIALPVATVIEIFGWALIDPDPTPTPTQQLLRGLLHD